MTWDHDTYPRIIRDEVHDYDRLQEQLVAAASGLSPRSILDLGIGGGETARRILRTYPDAHLVGIDSSPEMLRGAERFLPLDRVKLLERDLKDPLPVGHFDLIVSALAIHHLEGEQKAVLFHRVAEVLVPGGRFVIGDVVVPEEPSEAVIEIQPGYDFPSSVHEQLQWMTESGLAAERFWTCGDLAVLRGESPR